MALLFKKVGGLGLVVLGGLIVVHGAAAERMWESWLGLLLLVIGAVLLALKVVRRNLPDAGPVDS